MTGPGGDILLQSYQIAYWEHAGERHPGDTSDEAAAADLLELLEERARLYVRREHVRSVAQSTSATSVTALPERSGRCAGSIGVRPRSVPGRGYDWLPTPPESANHRLD